MFLQKIFNKKTKGLWYMLFALVLPLLGASLVSTWAYKQPLATIPFFSWYFVAVVLVGIFLMSFGLLPTTFASIIVGYFWGWTGLAIMIPSYTLAALIGYQFYRYLLGDAQLSDILNSSKGQKIVKGLSKNQYLLVIGGRLSPVLPFAFMNALLGYVRCDLKAFMIAGAVGMIPRTTLAVWAGIKIKQALLSPTDAPKDILSFVVLLLISLVIMGWMMKKIFEEKEDVA